MLARRARSSCDLASPAFIWLKNQPRFVRAHLQPQRLPTPPCPPKERMTRDSSCMNIRLLEPATRHRNGSPPTIGLFRNDRFRTPCTPLSKT
jgi:hypothetical protein